MSISGDIQQFPGIQFGVTLFITTSGEVSLESSESQIIGAIKVIDGSREDVLNLIGYARNEIEYLIHNDVLRATDQVKTRLKQLQRIPNSFILEDNGKLYGVVIDGNRQCRVVGVVNRVIPGHHSSTRCHSVLIDRDDNWMFLNINETDIETKVYNRALFGITSKDGFLFLQLKRAVDEEKSDLILVLKGGYFLIESAKVDWVRAKGDDLIRSTIKLRECLVGVRGSCIRTNEGSFEVFGSQNSIMDFRTIHAILSRQSSFASNESIDCLIEDKSESNVSHSSPKTIERDNNNH